MSDIDKKWLETNVFRAFLGLKSNPKWLFNVVNAEVYHSFDGPLNKKLR
jgi:hypothetical protein